MNTASYRLASSRTNIPTHSHISSKCWLLFSLWRVRCTHKQVISTLRKDRWDDHLCYHVIWNDVRYTEHLHGREVESTILAVWQKPQASRDVTKRNLPGIGNIMACEGVRTNGVLNMGDEVWQGNDGLFCFNCRKENMSCHVSCSCVLIRVTVLRNTVQQNAYAEPTN